MFIWWSCFVNAFGNIFKSLWKLPVLQRGCVLLLSGLRQGVYSWLHRLLHTMACWTPGLDWCYCTGICHSAGTLLMERNWMGLSVVRKKVDWEKLGQLLGTFPVCVCVVCVGMHAYVCMCICVCGVCVCLRACMYASVCVCACVCLFSCVSACMCVHFYLNV